MEPWKKPWIFWVTRIMLKEFWFSWKASYWGTQNNLVTLKCCVYNSIFRAHCWVLEQGTSAGQLCWKKKFDECWSLCSNAITVDLKVKQYVNVIWMPQSQSMHFVTVWKLRWMQLDNSKNIQGKGQKQASGSGDYQTGYWRKKDEER